MYGFPVYLRGGNRAGVSAVQKAVRLVAAMALKDVSDGYNLGQVRMLNCTEILIFQYYTYGSSLWGGGSYVCA